MSLRALEALTTAPINDCGSNELMRVFGVFILGSTKMIDEYGRRSRDDEIVESNMIAAPAEWPTPMTFCPLINPDDRNIPTARPPLYPETP